MAQLPEFDSRTRRHMGLEFVVGSRPCPQRLFSGYSDIPLSPQKNNHFQIQIRSGECPHTLKRI